MNDTRSDHQPISGWSGTWITGPDAGRTRAFAADHTAVVGREARADLSCGDLTMEPFHLRVGLEADTWSIVQLAGRSPIRVAGDEITVGSSVLRLERTRIVCVASTDRPAAANVTVMRTPRTVPTWTPDPVTMPSELPAPHPPGTGGILPGVMALVGSVAVAVVFGQAMFVVFGAIGALTALGTWVAGRVTYRRRRRDHARATQNALERYDADVDAQRLAWSAFQHASAPALHRLITELHLGSAHIWRRRADHVDGHVAYVGVGDAMFDAVVVGPTSTDDRRPSGTVVPGQPVCIDLGPGARIAIEGGAADAVVRAAIVGLAIATGPADWQLVIVTEQPERWCWASGLPHLADGLGGIRLVTSQELLELGREGTAWTACHTVVVTDMTELLALRTSSVRRLIGSAPNVAVLAVVHQGGVIPAICRTVLETHVDGSARLVVDLQRGTPPVSLRFCGISQETARRCVAELARCRDPEDPRTAGSDMPRSVGLDGLLRERGIDPFHVGSIIASWARAPVDAAPCSPIGRAVDGVVDIDLVRDGPHALLAGTTGAGKSELLRSLVLGLACSVGPDQLTFVLVDYKGGSTFDALASLPHVVGTVTDLDGSLADRALRSLRAELTTRERILRDCNATDLTSARLASGGPVMPRLAVVVDEFAALAVEHPGFLSSLVGIAQRGRSLGVHLLLATQRPNGVIDEAIRANTTLRVALRLNDAADAIDVVGDPLPATFSRSIPGRAVMRLGPDELVEFQTASCRSEAPEFTAECVAAIGAAARELGTDAPRRPWLEPLPACLDASAVSVGSVGVVDLPDEQTHAPLTWGVSDGHLLVAGSAGSGVTSTLHTLVAAVLQMPSPPAVYVIDGLGDAAWADVAVHPRCAAAVRTHDRERLWRLLHHLADRRAGQPAALLVIDGVECLRRELEPFERALELDLFERLVAEADTLGVTLLLGTDGVARLPSTLIARCPSRWLMHLHDAHDGAVFGVPATSIPAAIPGRIVRAGPGLANAQVVAPALLASARKGLARTERLDVLSCRFDGTQLPLSSRCGAVWRVMIGTRFDDLAPLPLDVHDGDHVLIVGPGRTGKSEALVRCVAAWHDAASDDHDAAAIATVMIAPRRSPLVAAGACLHAGVYTSPDGALSQALAEVLTHLAAGRPTLLAIDDAELVHDGDGRLTALIAARTAGLVVVAAGRGDALRQTYGHWTAAVRRSRLGVMLTGASDVDADLFGVVLPRSIPLAARPGLAHVVDRGELVLAQLAGAMS